MTTVVLRDVPAAVLWLDPGLTTGWALLEHGRVFSAGQVHGTVEAGQLVWDVLGRHYGSAAVGWEAYLIGRGARLTGNPTPSLEVIGAARWIAHHRSARVLPSVPAASRMIASPEMLRRLGWSVRGDHARDAARHLTAWCLRGGHLREELRGVYDVPVSE